MPDSSPSKTPFQQVTDDLTGGCGCACHTGTGYRTSCEHCSPAPRPHSTLDKAVEALRDLEDALGTSTVEEWTSWIRTALHDYGSLLEQFGTLYDIAVRVSEADNQRLGAEGEPGFEAMREMEDALAALHQFVASIPAKDHQ